MGRKVRIKPKKKGLSTEHDGLSNNEEERMNQERAEQERTEQERAEQETPQQAERRELYARLEEAYHERKVLLPYLSYILQERDRLHVAYRDSKKRARAGGTNTTHNSQVKESEQRLRSMCKEVEEVQADVDRLRAEAMTLERRKAELENSSKDG